MPDFNAREWACVIPLVVMMVWMGVYSQTFLPEVSEANTKIIDRKQNDRAAARSSPSHRSSSIEAI